MYQIYVSLSILYFSLYIYSTPRNWCGFFFGFFFLHFDVAIVTLFPMNIFTPGCVLKTFPSCSGRAEDHGTLKHRTIRAAGCRREFHRRWETENWFQWSLKEAFTDGPSRPSGNLKKNWWMWGVGAEQWSKEETENVWSWISMHSLFPSSDMLWKFWDYFMSFSDKFKFRHALPR